MQSDYFTEGLQRESLRIIVLGPGEAQPQDLRKRCQIKSRLLDNGYSRAKLGEDVLGEPEAPLHIALLSEMPHIDSEMPHIDLLLVLNTGPAPLVELTTISFDYNARQKTRVWWKREYAEGARSTPGDVVGMFDNWPFSAEEFESCELVESILATAERFCMSKAQREGRLTGFRLPPPSW